MPSTPPSTPSSAPDDDPDGSPEFGPGGYLPPQAAARARKIVLRERMGLQWAVAAALAGVLILALAIPALLARTGPPAAPFVEVARLADVDPRGDELFSIGGEAVLVLRAGGVPRAFLEGGSGARYCAASGRLESPDGTVWSAEGRLIGGEGRSLALMAVQVYDGVLYVDTSAPTPALEPRPGAVVPACGNGG